jgi:hypothetical protein
VPIPDGQVFVPYFVQGLENTTGSASVTVAPSAAFPTATHVVNVVRAGVEIAGLDATTTRLSASDTEWLVQVGVPVPGNMLLGTVQSVRAGGPPFVVTLTNSNATVARLISDQPPAEGQVVSKTIPAGFSATQATSGGSSNGLVFDPEMNGTTTISAAGPPGVATMLATGTRTVTVGGPGIALPAAFFVGAGLQSGSAATLAGSDHGGVEVTIASSDPGLVLVSPDAATPGAGSVTVHLANGQTSVPFFVQGVENMAGSATVTVSAAGFASAAAPATVAPIAVQIGGLDHSIAVGGADDTDWWVEVGVPNLDRSALSLVQAVRAGGPAFIVTVSTGTAGVAELRSDDSPTGGQTVTKQIQPGAYYSQAVVGGTSYGLALDPTTAGATIVSVTGPPGVGTTGLGGRTVDVTP